MQDNSTAALAPVLAHDTFWAGYAGYFKDPDRHLWEVVWNPHLEVS
jgi:predicted lactoylglutathione lyase